ncbi:MAG: helix-turn-helix transcriptional regulator [Paludibacteraceae bacterium]|nr:helix-turn-helix transcriptional regulator [Paludibacteraceae bacterium]
MLNGSLDLFFVLFSYLFPLIMTVMFIFLIAITPQWRSDKQKKAILIFLIAWLPWLLALVVWEVFVADPPYPVFDFFFSLSGLLTFPFIYNYIVVVTSQRGLTFNKWIAWFSLPFLLLISWIIIVLIQGELPFVYSVSDFIAQLHSAESWIRVAGFLGYCVYAILIVILGIKRYLMYKENIANDFSYTHSISLNWIIYMLGLFFIFAALSGISFFAGDVFVHATVNIINTVLILMLVCCGLRHQNPYSEYFLPLSDISTEDTQIDEENVEVSSMIKRFTNLFEQEKVWLHCELSAEDVVRMLGTNRTYFSRFVKEHYAANFRTLVNSYRIKEAVMLLENNPNLPVSEIAIKTGFASISSFNLWFNKLTTVSPSQYKENIKNKGI